MNDIKIADIQKGERFEGFLLVKNAQSRINKNGSPYMDLTLADNTQDINAKLWDRDDTPPQPGTVIKVRAMVTEYNGKLQFKIELMRPALDTDNVDMSELVSAAPRPSDEMFGELKSYIDKMTNPVLKALTEEMVRRAGDKIHYYPAAQSMHHAQRSGLLHHLTDMLSAAKAICACYPFLELDLVVAGVIVHDLGKLVEMIADETGAVSEYSKEGMLLGHIITGVSDLRDAAKALGYNEDDEYPLLLEHMILSHHGIPEYGSPRPPMFPEAEVLHWLDVLDSRLNEMLSALARTNQGAFSDKIYALDRRLYHPKYLNEPALSEQENESDTNIMMDSISLDTIKTKKTANKQFKQQPDADKEYNRFLL